MSVVVLCAAGLTADAPRLVAEATPASRVEPM